MTVDGSPARLHISNAIIHNSSILTQRIFEFSQQKNKFTRSSKKKEHSSDQGGIPTEEIIGPIGDKNRLLLSDKKNQVPHQQRYTD